MNKPNYENSIVNVSASILHTFGKKTLYKPLKELKDLKQYKNVILLVVDGLGNEFFQKYGKNSFLHKYFIRSITSTFPSTTASASVALQTGVAPAQHGLTGWDMYLKELGGITTILPFITRCKAKFPSYIKRDFILEEKDIAEKISNLSYRIYPSSLKKVKEFKNKKNMKWYSNLQGMFMQVKKCINSSMDKKLIYCYYPDLDYYMHNTGVDSQEAIQNFLDIDKSISNFVKRIKGTDTAIIITADHGLIDTPNMIKLEDHPELQDSLVLPLSGEPRTVYCYVRSGKEKLFLNYIRTKLQDYCDVYKSEDLIKKNFFGLPPYHSKLKDRIGDYTLIMKQNYILKDLLLGETIPKNKANHGGVSKEEMFVPLIYIK